VKTLHFISLVKSFASLSCEVAASGGSMCFCFTALRLHGGVVALIYSGAMLY